MTLKEITEQYLKENGFDGLVQPDGECGCCMSKHGIFSCCDFALGPHSDCKPAYIHEAPEGFMIEDEEGECHDWLMCVEKEADFVVYKEEQP